MRLQTDGEATFASLKVDVELKHLPKAVRSPWISKETWRLEDWRAALLRAGQESTREVHKARRDFQRALQGDRRRRVQLAGSNIEGLLEAVRVKEAWVSHCEVVSSCAGETGPPHQEGTGPRVDD